MDTGTRKLSWWMKWTRHKRDQEKRKCYGKLSPLKGAGAPYFHVGMWAPFVILSNLTKEARNPKFSEKFSDFWILCVVTLQILECAISPCDSAFVGDTPSPLLSPSTCLKTWQGDSVKCWPNLSWPQESFQSSSIALNTLHCNAFCFYSLVLSRNIIYSWLF